MIEHSVPAKAVVSWGAFFMLRLCAMEIGNIPWIQKLRIGTVVTMTLDLTDLGDTSARRDIYGHENLANGGMASRRLFVTDRCICKCLVHQYVVSWPE